jgi:hypothetical protein
VRDWPVADPVAEDYETHCQNGIETRMMGLILELRRARAHRTLKPR